MFLDYQTSKNPSTNKNAISNLNNQNKEYDQQPTLKRQLIKFRGEKKLRNIKDKLILLLTQTKEPRV